MHNALFRIGLEFIYRIQSKGRHGVHSPRVYAWLDALKNDRGISPAPKSFRRIAREMNWGEKTIAFTDYGTGPNRRINLEKWGKQAASPAPKRKFIQALVRTLNVAHILEMGTALGTTTADLARIREDLCITTVEGDPGLLHSAINYWSREDISNEEVDPAAPAWDVRNGASNVDFGNSAVENGTEEPLEHTEAHQPEKNHGPAQIKACCGPFAEVLPQLPMETFDLVIVDGDHRGSAITHWAHWIADRAPNAFLLIDDIRWSRDMWEAWTALRKDSRWLLTLDFGQMGLLTPVGDRVKEHFVLRKYVS